MPDTNGSTASPLARIVTNPPAVPPAARRHFAEFSSALADCSGMRPTGHTDPPPLAAQIERLRRFYEPIFEHKYDHARLRIRDIEQLEQIASGYRSRTSFITDLALDPPSATSDLAGPPWLDDDWLTLSTIHSAKGCEWDVVHVIHAADGMIPSDMSTQDETSIDEERRLFYVAMTRAKDHLYVYFPLRYYHKRYALGDTHGYAQLTRFITPDVKALFEDRADGTYDDSTTPLVPRGPSRVEELNQWLSGLWGT
jgi:DNA helicase-2/ATP-dependent DNA helicase PcrA